MPFEFNGSKTSPQTLNKGNKTLKKTVRGTKKQLEKYFGTN